MTKNIVLSLIFVMMLPALVWSWSSNALRHNDRYLQYDVSNDGWVANDTIKATKFYGNIAGNIDGSLTDNEGNPIFGYEPDCDAIVSSKDIITTGILLDYSSEGFSIIDAPSDYISLRTLDDETAGHSGMIMADKVSIPNIKSFNHPVLGAFGKGTNPSNYIAIHHTGTSNRGTTANGRAIIQSGTGVIDALENDGVNYAFFNAKVCEGALYETTDINSSGTLVTCTTGSTWYSWTSATVGRVTGAGYVTGSADTDSLTIGANGAGVYQIVFNACYSGDNDETEAGVFLNNNASPITGLKTSTHFSITTSSCRVVNVPLAANDYLTVKVRSRTNGTKIYIQEFYLQITRIGKL